MMIYLRCIAGSQAKTTTTKTTTKINSALHFIVKFIYQKSFFFAAGDGDVAGKTNKREKQRKVLMEYCRKFCRKAHANKKETLSHTLAHTCAQQITKANKKRRLKCRHKNFRGSGKTKKNDRKTAKCGKINVAFLLHFVPLFYAAAAVCELLAANCSHVCVWGGGDTAAFLTTPLAKRKWTFRRHVDCGAGVRDEANIEIILASRQAEMEMDTRAAA